MEARVETVLGLAVILACTLLLMARPERAAAVALTVNTTSDGDDGACSADHCTLREAITAANASPGPDTIRFDVAGPGPHVIALGSSLPALTDDRIEIDGTTEPDYAGTPVVVIQPCMAPSLAIEPGALPGGFISLPGAIAQVCSPPAYALWIEASDSVIRGLSIVGFDSPTDPNSGAIVVNGGSGTLIELNYIGLEPPARDWGNAVGVRLGQPGQLVLDNVISGNDVGIEIWAGDQTIQRNIIGLDPTGVWKKRNTIGIHVPSFYPPTTGSGAALVIGGPGEGNTISGNEVGVKIENASTGISVQGNSIGTNPSGVGWGLGNYAGLVVMGSTGTVIGGAGPGEGNLLAGNQTWAARLEDDTSGIIVMGNVVGLDANGEARSNHDGIRVAGEGHTIGGLGPGQGNVISANESDGLKILGMDHLVQGNNIGTDTAGTGDRGNGHYGVSLNGDGTEVSSNLIAFNQGDGVIVRAGAGNTISQNTMFDNGGAGIDLRFAFGSSWMSDGVTPNDPGDADVGPNELRNYPEWTSVTSSLVEGLACAGCTVEVFLADNGPSDHGEGLTFMGSTVAAADGSFSVPISGVAFCAPVTATATDGDGNTSEFSLNVRANCIVLQPWMLVLPVVGLAFFAAGVGGAFASARGLSPVGYTVGGAIGGGLAGAAVSVVVVALPSVMLAPRVSRPVIELGPAPLAACDTYLDPNAFAPPEGSLFQTYERPTFSWSPMPGLPSGEIRWRVDLLGPGGLGLNRRTAEMSLAFGAFGVLPEPGDEYQWSVVGERAEPGGDLWLPFCDAESYLSFQMGERAQAGPPPWTREAPARTTLTLTPTATPTLVTPARLPPTRTPTPTTAPDTTGPAIKAVSDAPDPIYVTQPKGCSPNASVVSASITDPSGLASAVVILFHTTIGQVPMTNVGGNNWQATLGPYIGVGDGTVDYQIRATDGEGNASDTVFYQVTVLACVP